VPAEGPAPAIVLLHGPESIAAWKKARPDADVIVVPGTGHEPAVDEVVDPLYERTMAGWLKRLA